MPEQAKTMMRPGKPILVVEDHEDTREMVEMFLRQDGYAVCTAADGSKALECVERETPCLILLDVMMPVMDGPTFARHLREWPDQGIADTPIVLLTAVADTRDLQRQTGAVDVIAKPVSFDRVTSVVERHCDLTSGNT
jgi:CheY-like chemotaxis protein